MTYEAWTWFMIGLIIIAVLGLVGTIILDIGKRSTSAGLSGVRTALAVLGLIGAAGFASLSFGVFPLGHPGAATANPSGVTTGQTGVITQGLKSTSTSGQ